MFSYLKGATKTGFVLDTPKLINVLDINYSADRGKFIKKLNPNKPMSLKYENWAHIVSYYKGGQCIKYPP